LTQAKTTRYQPVRRGSIAADKRSVRLFRDEAKVDLAYFRDTIFSHHASRLPSTMPFVDTDLRDAGGRMSRLKKPVVPLRGVGKAIRDHGHCHQIA
jgi:hypothetical protein